jgi:hypothetical protein
MTVATNRRHFLQGTSAALVAGFAPRAAWGRTEVDVVIIGAGLAGLICPLLGGPKSMLFWTRKEKTNAIQDTHAGGDYRQAA